VAAGDELLGRGGPDRTAFDGAEQLPPGERRRIDLELALTLPDRNRLPLGAGSGNAPAVKMIPQRVKTPGEILQRIAKMRHLPIEHGEDAPATVVQEIARAVAARPDGYFLRRFWRIAAQPAHRRACDRLRVPFVTFDHRLPGVQSL